ncbi:odorant receptor 33a-like isoform X2 [Rhodnius prolixus]|uniref:odorant receptor 33a-like isoform X2 n=1 Tax=Rhodnius prolixus TaxID=13249 RepID=UPI003D18AF8A
MILLCEMADEQLDLDEIDSVYYKVLRKIFFQIFRRNDEGFVVRKTLKIICLGFAFSLMSCYVSIQAFHWNLIEDFTQRMINLALIINVLSIIIRFIVFCSLTDEMESLFLNFETFHCNQHRPLYSIKVLNEAYKKTLNVDFWASTFFAVNVFNWFIFPIFANKVMLNLITGQNVTYEEWLANLPTSFSFEVQNPWKEIRYLFEFIEATVANLVWLTSDVIYYAIVNMLKTQLTLLGESIIRKENDSVDKLEPLSYKHFVQDHNQLIRVCRTLERILSPVLGAQLMTTGVLLGGILLTITSGPENDVADMSGYAVFYAKFLVYMMIALLELYLYCWLSDITNTAYVDIGKAVYNSEWYMRLDADARNSLLTLKITQKGINITALKMVKIDLRTFIEVLRLSYSYFTIMKRRIKNDEDIS